MQPEPILEIHHLHKSFGAIKATDDITLDLKPGEIHALIGPNGAGKSTLIGQIAGWIKPDAGSIRFMNQDITALSPAQRAQLGLGRSFQISSLATEFSALRNVMLSVQARSGSSYRFFKPVASDYSLIEPARAALATVGLEDRANIPVSDLSHGECRKLEVACALALKPRALLLDEPMAGLGMDGTEAMTAFLVTLKRTLPMLLIEHDMDAVFALADRISVLVYGRVIATGTVAEIRTNAAVRDAYLGEIAHTGKAHPC